MRLWWYYRHRAHWQRRSSFITQQVTIWHNWILAFLVVCLGSQALRRRSKLLSVITVGLLTVILMLFIDHAHLTRQMDFEHSSVPTHFYSQHAIYLWLTAIEWLLGFAVPFALRTKP